MYRWQSQRWLWNRTEFFISDRPELTKGLSLPTVLIYIVHPPKESKNFLLDPNPNPTPKSFLLDPNRILFNSDNFHIILLLPLKIHGHLRVDNTFIFHL
jgi:hypothetical protein